MGPARIADRDAQGDGVFAPANVAGGTLVGRRDEGFAGGALVGLGRRAMGLGDVHLMFGVGAIVGAGAATVAFFLAPFFGILIAIYMLLTGTKREIPYGPYLSIATAAVLLFGCEILNYLTPGVMGLN